ncbi:MAG: YgiQ family radical SAM protein [Muribaculaceae bacterium]|nr:YgiQ family radical SAM protein [Muribaculaceae bacterium]
MGNVKNPIRKEYFLPTTRDEMIRLGWDQADIIIFSGDAYVDHPSFGASVIGRVLQNAGFKVAIVPQPNWRDDLRDFKKLGRPRLFFGVSAGAMDSMVNHYTAGRRLRHDDAYTPGGRHGMRPDYPTIVYSKILKELYPDSPVIAGGIEASLRRVSHYDYWQDKLRPSILSDSGADMLCYGMGERTMLEIARQLDSGIPIHEITDIPQTVLFSNQIPASTDIRLHSYEDCLKNKKLQAANFKFIEEESNKYEGKVIWQKTGNKMIKINPLFHPMTEDEMDAIYSLPFTRMPHPRYKGKDIPAYNMIRHSVTLHRGCFGGCSFCTISAHQGKFISSRSKESVLKEVKQITEMNDFKGYISDLGGPSANMYSLKGKDIEICKKCKKPSCLHPVVCPNLNVNHSKLLDLYKSASSIEGVKKTFVGSGVRYDLAMAPVINPVDRDINNKYIEELIEHHVSGRLKVAPEHTSDHVLNLMRKPSFSLFKKFKAKFESVNRAQNLKQELIPYFISSHPGCKLDDMADLVVETKDLNYHLEQVQDFTPTPMTLSTEIYYSGINPYTGEKIYIPKTEEEKKFQKQFFFWYKPELFRDLSLFLKKVGRIDILKRLSSNSERNYRKKNSKRERPEPY